MAGLRARMYQWSSALERFIAPGNSNAQSAYEEALESAHQPEEPWLDIGCGHQLLPSWRARKELEIVRGTRLVVGADLDLDAIRRHRSFTCRVLAGVPHLPFASGTFGLVTANVVVEHFDNPSLQFAEIARVLKPGGAFLFHTPNALGYTVRASKVMPEALKVAMAVMLEGRTAADVYPAYYRANTESDIASAASEAGLVVEKLAYLSSPPVFSVIPPLAVFELAWLRALRSPANASLRSNLIVLLRRPPVDI